ncbi:MAG: nucleotidyltransferase [Anaerolineaceae bacterium]|nr:nucleotidyltransferase [Anaerolineaceae bacterium]
MIYQTSIPLPLEAIDDYCKRHPIKRLSLFGSVLRDDFSHQSDVDLLVEYVPGARITLLDMAQQEIDLGEIIGHKVDLRTPNELSKHFRQHILNTAVPIYERN